MRRELINFLILFPAFLLFQPKITAQTLHDKIQNCATTAGSDVTYLKDFIVKLDANKPNERPPVYRNTLVLRKDVTYRFIVCELEDSEGEAVLRLFDESSMIASTFYPETGKEYKSVNFVCQKSGVYTIMINFKEGKPGKAIGIMSYLDK